MRVYTKEHCFLNGFGLHLRHKRIRTDEPEHLHEFVEIVYVLSGDGVHGIDGVEYSVRRGSMLFMNYKQIHYFKTSSEMEIAEILLDPEWISEKLIELDNAFELLTLSSFSEFGQRIGEGQPFLSFSGGERSRLERLIVEMLEEQEVKQVGYETILKAQANILLTIVFRAMAGRSGERETLGPDFLENLRQRCAEKLSLQELARSCFYNPAYFSRIFKECYGITVTEFISQSRLEKAKRLLEETAMPVEEVALACGFGSKNAFYKLFRAHLGMTPKEYRDRVKKGYKIE